MRNRNILKPNYRTLFLRKCSINGLYFRLVLKLNETF